MERRIVTDKEFIDLYQPLGAWLLVEKDILPEKTSGGIILATQARESNIKTSMTGVIKKKSDFATFETSWEDHMYASVEIGDRIGFSMTTPMIAPAPPGFYFEDGEQESVKFVTLHVVDVLAIMKES